MKYELYNSNKKFPFFVSDSLSHSLLLKLSMLDNYLRTLSLVLQIISLNIGMLIIAS